MGRGGILATTPVTLDSVLDVICLDGILDCFSWGERKRNTLLAERTVSCTFGDQKCKLFFIRFIQQTFLIF